MTKSNRSTARIHEAALRLYAEKGNTDISVVELADAAGLARGTVYNNLQTIDHLFQHVAAELADEMNRRIVASFQGIDNPAERLSVGIRLYAKRAHEEPAWGRFLLHFSMTNESLGKMWGGIPQQDLVEGMRRGIYDLSSGQEMAAIGMVAGTTLSAIQGIVTGLQTWREAGSHAAELVLRALGITSEEAKLLSSSTLPPLAHLP